MREGQGVAERGRGGRWSTTRQDEVEGPHEKEKVVFVVRTCKGWSGVLMFSSRSLE